VRFNQPNNQEIYKGSILTQNSSIHLPRNLLLITSTIHLKTI
jgi:hypothetical protein